MAPLIAFILLTNSLQHSYSESVPCTQYEDCSCGPISIHGKSKCTLDCSAEDSCDGSQQSTLTCRSGAPCEILCEGEGSCQSVYINASLATDVYVNCGVENACTNGISDVHISQIRCGTGFCEINCVENACINAIVFQDDFRNVTGFECSPIANCLHMNGGGLWDPFIAPTIAPTISTPTTAYPTSHGSTQNPMTHPSPLSLDSFITNAPTIANVDLSTTKEQSETFGVTIHI